MRIVPLLAVLFTFALGDFSQVFAQGEFNARATINVTGSGNVPTESDYVPNCLMCENGLASFEALKAQAVAARTYAYYQMDNKGFINDGTIDQVYSCAGSPSSIHYLAAAATEGEILWVRDNDNNGAQKDVLIASFYVAGAIPSGPFDANNPGVIVDPGDSDPTDTEKWVTYTYDSGDYAGFNMGTPLGFRGTVSNPNWPNRGAKSQNGAHYLSDNSVSYLDILKYYYGADIQLRTATTAGTSVQYGLKTLVNFDNYTGLTDGTISGHEGTFHRSPTFSGSTTANVAGSTAERSSAEAFSGSHSQLIDITYDESSGTDFLLRHVSGARYDDDNSVSNRAAQRIANIQVESIGSIGFWLKTDDVGLTVSLAMDDPNSASDVTSTERGEFRSVIADNQWHKYEWFLEEESEWDAWVGGSNGEINATHVSIDSIQLIGSSDAQVYLDDVFWDPQAVFTEPLPGDFDGSGTVDGTDLAFWESGYGQTAGATISSGDANADGAADGQDFLLWQQNFGVSSASVAVRVVPEPGGLLLLVFGWIVALSIPERRVRQAGASA